MKIKGQDAYVEGGELIPIWKQICLTCEVADQTPPSSLDSFFFQRLL
jgi:hypothetical protein